MEAPLYNLEGEKVGTVALSDKMFGVRSNPTLIHEVVRLLQSSRRAGTAHTKDRGDVRGGGKKPWRQKGTGRARHGSRRSPIWVGGGITHGPRSEKNYERKINKNARRKALASLLSQKLKEHEIVFVDQFEMSAGKTKNVATALKKFSTTAGFDKLGGKGGRTLILLEGSHPSTIRAVRNLPFVDIMEARNVNVEEALIPKFLMITKKSLDKIVV